MSEKRKCVVVVTAHPDDEIFVSGVMCLCAEKGFSVVVVCVADGSGGSLDLVHPGADKSLSKIRRKELLLSAWVLGVQEVLFLEQSDILGGEDVSWNLTYVTEALGEIIQKQSADLVLTHGPLGGYGNPAHTLVYRCVMSAVNNIQFAGSIFSFCGGVDRAFFSWQFDENSDVIIDVRGFLRRRAASLSYHQSQIDFFLQPYFPRTLRKGLSALFGFAFIFTEAGRKRVPIATAERFFKRFPQEGLVLRKGPEGRLHFFQEHFKNDIRVKINS